MYEIETYKTESGRCPVEDYISKLSKQGNHQEIAQIITAKDRLSQYGMAVNNYYPNTIRLLRDDIYELRPGKNRVFFFHFVGNKMVLLHAYRKHSKKTPPSEINQAEKEMKDYKRREKNEQ